MTTIKELLPISNNKIGEDEINAVSARDLHKFLGITERFQQWVNKQLSFGFEENVDFIGCKIFNTLANLELQDYCLSLDCAKQVAMMQRNEKGTEARKYFIECEKEYKKTLENYIPKTLPDALEAYALELRRHEETKLLLEEAKPKADFYDIAVASSSTVDIGEAAKILKYKATGRNNLFKFLRREGVLMKNNAPKQEYVNKGWFKLVEYKVNGEVKIKTLVYQKGLDGIRKMLNEAGLLPEAR